jgi:hypothetical protein
LLRGTFFDTTPNTSERAQNYTQQETVTVAIFHILLRYSKFDAATQALRAKHAKPFPQRCATRRGIVWAPATLELQ